MTTLAFRAIDELSAAWAPLLWRASWQGGMALLLVFAISRGVQNLPAYVRCWLWRLAFFKLLIAGLWSFPVELHWLPPVESTATATESPLAAFEVVRDSIPGQDEAAGRARPGPERHSRPGPLSWLMMVWIAGVVLGSTNLVRQWVKLRRTVSRLAWLADERVCHGLAENCSRMGLRRTPELRVMNDRCSPFLTGIWRPVIVFPASVLAACTADELKVALIHELAHIRRRDLVWNWLPALAEAIFFFHPLVWLARREWHMAQETSTDELAVSVPGVCLATYANALVELTAKCSTVSVRPHFRVAAGESYLQLSRRLMAMQTIRKLTPRRRLATAVVVLTIGVLGVVPWKLAAREATDQPAAAASLQDKDKVADAAQDDPTSSSRKMTIHVVGPDGRPMQDVQVFRNHAYQPKGVEQPRIENKTYLTDSDGKAVISLSGTSLDLRLWATKKNFVPLHAMWAKSFQSDGDRIPDTFTFQLRPGTTIGGLIKNEKGEPIEGVKVEVLDRAVEQLHALPLDQPGKRPVMSQMLAEGESAVFTDKDGRWSLGNVSSDKGLAFDDNQGERFFDDDIVDRDPHTRFLLRLTHPDYVGGSKWGRLQFKQDITDESLRNQTATIVMQRGGN